MEGETACKFHGGAAGRVLRGKPKPSTTKHGLYATAISDDMREDHDDALAALQSDGGLSVVDGGVAIRHAAVKRFLRERRDGTITPEETDALLRALNSMDAGIKTRTEVIAASKEEVPSQINIALANPAASALVTVRGPDGASVQALRAPNGDLLLPTASGAWVPARKTITEEGAEVWQPLLLASG